MTDNGMKIIKSAFIVDGRDHHVEALVGKLRQADIDEIAASTGGDPDEILRRSWNNSKIRYAIMWKGEVVGVFGVAPLWLSSMVGIVWMMGSDRVSEISLSMVRLGREFIEKMMDEYPVLCNWVDARNELSIKWLKKVGFEVSDKVSAVWGGDVPFHFFEIGRLK